MNSSDNPRLSRRFDASAERVFDAWLDPEKVRKWFAPGLGERKRTVSDINVTSL